MDTFKSLNYLAISPVIPHCVALAHIQIPSATHYFPGLGTLNLGDGDTVFVELWRCKYFLLGYIVNTTTHSTIKSVGFKSCKTIRSRFACNAELSFLDVIILCSFLNWITRVWSNLPLGFIWFDRAPSKFIHTQFLIYLMHALVQVMCKSLLLSDGCRFD